MFIYEKKLLYPVNITQTNPQLAMLLTQLYGGKDGEMASAMQYLTQRYTMPYSEINALLTDIGMEELNHLEVIGAVIHQLTRNLTETQMKEAGFAPYFINHSAAVYPASVNETWSVSDMACNGDPIADLTENLASEQRSRVTYDNLLRVSDDPDVNQVLRFLRARELTHYHRFAEALDLVQQKLNPKNIYYMNPALDL